MSKFSFLLFIIILFPVRIFSLNSDSLVYSGKYYAVVDSFKIKGNKITEREIILRELTFEKGDTVSNKIVDYNRERIFSLGIFTRVDLYIKNSDGINILFIDVDESWYIYPIPFVELKDRDWEKISYGMNVVIQNFRGRNELLRFRGSLGYDPSILVNYRNPVFFYNADIFFDVYFSYVKNKNRSITAELLYGDEFEQKIFRSQLTIGKRFGNYNRLSLGLGYDYVATPVYIKGISASDERIDRLPVVVLAYSYDTRDLSQFPKDGIFASASLQFKGMGVNQINYRIANIDFREYRNIFNDLYFKWRFSTRLTFGGLIPYYDYSYIGYFERIRGHFGDEQEGHNSYVGSVEFYYPLVKDININLDFVPVIPKELLSYRIALYAQIFGDAGAVKLRKEKLNINSFQSGYGAGITFLILPYNTLRIEFALDEHGKSEWILDLGLSF